MPSTTSSLSPASTAAFIAASPFIFVHQLNCPDYEVGIYLAILVSGIWLGSVLATRLIARIGVPFRPALYLDSL